MNLKISNAFSLLKLPTTAPNSRKNIVKGYYHSYLMCIARIIRYSNLMAVSIFPDFKNKAREVNIEVFKGKYLGTLIGAGDAKARIVRYHLSIER